MKRTPNSHPFIDRSTPEYQDAVASAAAKAGRSGIEVTTPSHTLAEADGVEPDVQAPDSGLIDASHGHEADDDTATSEAITEAANEFGYQRSPETTEAADAETAAARNAEVPAEPTRLHSIPQQAASPELSTAETHAAIRAGNQQVTRSAHRQHTRALIADGLTPSQAHDVATAAIGAIQGGESPTRFYGRASAGAARADAPAATSPASGPVREVQVMVPDADIQAAADYMNAHTTDEILADIRGGNSHNILGILQAAHAENFITYRRLSREDAEAAAADYIQDIRERMMAPEQDPVAANMLSVSLDQLRHHLTPQPAHAAGSAEVLADAGDQLAPQTLEEKIASLRSGNPDSRLVEELAGRYAATLRSRNPNMSEARLNGDVARFVLDLRAGHRRTVNGVIKNLRAVDRVEQQIARAQSATTVIDVPPFTPSPNASTEAEAVTALTTEELLAMSPADVLAAIRANDPAVTAALTEVFMQNQPARQSDEAASRAYAASWVARARDTKYSDEMVTGWIGQLMDRQRNQKDVLPEEQWRQPRLFDSSDDLLPVSERHNNLMAQMYANAAPAAAAAEAAPAVPNTAPARASARERVARMTAPVGRVVMGAVQRARNGIAARRGVDPAAHLREPVVLSTTIDADPGTAAAEPVTPALPYTGRTVSAAAETLAGADDEDVTPRVRGFRGIPGTLRRSFANGFAAQYGAHDVSGLSNEVLGQHRRSDLYRSRMGLPLIQAPAPAPVQPSVPRQPVKRQPAPVSPAAPAPARVRAPRFDPALVEALRREVSPTPAPRRTKAAAPTTQRSSAALRRQRSTRTA